MIVIAICADFASEIFHSTYSVELRLLGDYKDFVAHCFDNKIKKLISFLTLLHGKRTYRGAIIIHRSGKQPLQIPMRLRSNSALYFSNLTLSTNFIKLSSREQRATNSIRNFFQVFRG